VTARVIELPLKDAYTGLPSSVFPGPKEQILAMMRGDRLWEQFEPWNEFAQLMLRFHEYLDHEFYDRKGTLLYYLGRADKWTMDRLEKPLGLETAAQIVYTINFLATLVVTRSLILWPWHFVKEPLDFLSYPKRGDQILGDPNYKEWNFWDDFMGLLNMFDQVFDDAILAEDTKWKKSYYAVKTMTGSGALSSTESSVTTGFTW
jgi:hypothetical protein